MQSDVLAESEIYHLYTRGVRKQEIFHEQRDYARFIYLLIHFQGEYSPTNISKSVNRYFRQNSFGTSESSIANILENRIVALMAFCIMPNHIHLCIEQASEDGVSRYMHRVLTAYAKYYNEKYKMSGHVFQSKFGRVLVEDNDQLLYLSSYIHRNQREISSWTDKEADFPWSSYADYARENRWGKLLSIDMILGQFDDSTDYCNFVQSSPAKAPEATGMDV